MWPGKPSEALEGCPHVDAAAKLRSIGNICNYSRYVVAIWAAIDLHKVYTAYLNNMFDIG